MVLGAIVFCAVANGQTISLTPTHPHSHRDVLYFGTWNELRIETRNDSFNLKYLLLYSDSIQTRKHKNGIFEVKPFFPLKEWDKAKITIYIIDERIGKIDSTLFEVWYYPFNFEVVRKNNYPSYPLYRDMKSLRVKAAPFCKDAINATVITYEIALYRDSSLLLKATIIGTNDFPKTFTDSVSLLVKPDDIIIAKDIMLKTKRGEVLLIPFSQAFSPFRRPTDFVH